MKLDNVSFAFYMNASCGLPGHKPCHSVGPHTDTSPVYAPDASLAGVARYKDRFHSHTQFYKDAAAGELPAFTWLNCAAEAADHPCSDMAKGERCQKVRWIRFVACTVVADLNSGPAGYIRGSACGQALEPDAVYDCVRRCRREL